MDVIARLKGSQPVKLSEQEVKELTQAKPDELIEYRGTEDAKKMERLENEVQNTEEGRRGLGFDKKEHVKSGVYAGLEAKTDDINKLEGEEEEAPKEKKEEQRDVRREVMLAYLEEKIRKEREQKKKEK